MRLNDYHHAEQFNIDNKFNTKTPNIICFIPKLHTDLQSMFRNMQLWDGKMIMMVENLRTTTLSL